MIEYFHYCNKTRISWDHVPIVHSILLDLVNPLLFQQNIQLPLLKVLLTFVFCVLSQRQLITSLILNNDFLIFRAPRIEPLITQCLKISQKVAIKLRWPDIFKDSERLPFDCKVLVLKDVSAPDSRPAQTTMTYPSMHSPSLQPSHHSSPPYHHLEQSIEEMDNKIIFTFKREAEESAVIDHQNSLIYNNRDNTLIHDFFTRLSSLLSTFNEVSLANILHRLNKFTEEVFQCAIHTGVKLLSGLGNSPRRVLRFFRVVVEYDEEKSVVEHSPNTVLMSLLYLSCKQILESSHQEQAAEGLLSVLFSKFHHKLDDGFMKSLAIKSIKILPIESSDNCTGILKRRVVNRLMIDSHTFDSSIQSFLLKFARTNFNIIVDANCMSQEPDFFSMTKTVSSFIRQTGSIDDLLDFLVVYK